MTASLVSQHAVIAQQQVFEMLVLVMLVMLALLALLLMLTTLLLPRKPFYALHVQVQLL